MPKAPTSPAVPAGVTLPRRLTAAFVAVEAAAAMGYFTVAPSAAKVGCHAVLGLAPAVAVLVGVRAHRPQQRLAWYLLAVGQAAFIVGDTVNNVDAWILHVPAPSVTGDVLYLAMYPLAASGLVLLVRARTPGRDRASLIDAVVVATGAGLVSWEFLIVPYVRQPGLSLGERLVSAAYPLGDLLLLVLVVRLWRTGSHSPASRLLTTGMLALLVGDTVYSAVQLTAGWTAGGWLDLIWFPYYACLGAAALHPSMRSLSEPAAARPARLSWQRRAGLTGATLMAPAMLVVQWLRGEPLDVGVNAAGTTVLFTLLTWRLVDQAAETGRQQERQHALAQTVAAAQQERRRLAVDLHDGPVQELTALVVRLDRLRLRLVAGDLVAAGRLADQLEAALRTEVESLRRLLGELWPPALDRHGLDGALRRHAASFAERTGIAVDLDVEVEGDHRPTPTVETIIFRVVQEALANVAKHANAGAVWIRLAASQDGVRLLVRDDGEGFDPDAADRLLDAGHFGLAGMRERVEEAGGELTLTSRPAGGTVIRVALGPQPPAGRNDQHRRLQ